MNWKKMMAVGLAAVSMMAFVTGCGGDTKKANTELPKKVVIGLDDSFPPMGFKDEKGEIVGFDIDMAKEAAKRAGMDVEFKAIDWSSKEAELKSKKIDALWNGLTVSPEREKNILFSNTYMKDKQYVIVRNDDDSIKGKADLAGKVVGVQQASTGEAALQKDESGKTVKEIKSYADFVSAFMDLGIGRVDAVIADGVIARYLMTKEPGKYKIVEGTDYGVDNFAVGFRKDDKGEIVGFDIDMAKEAAKRAGMDVEFKAIDWSSKEAELKSKKIDALWNGLTVSPEREKNILFSNVYMKDKQYIIVRNEDESIKGKADLAGKVVGVQQASTGEAALQKDESGKTVKEIKSYADFVSAFMDLGIGRVDAVIADGVIARYLMTKEPGKYKIVEGTDYGVDDFAVGFRKEDTALRDKINGILAEMKKDGTADKIAEKWLGSGADLDKSDAK